jgi:antitoxin PrlF
MRPAWANYKVRCSHYVWGNALQTEVKVTRKFQVTIPKSVRSELGIKIGDKLTVKTENKQIILEKPKHIPNPSDTLWCLFGKPLKIDAAKLVEESLQPPAN